jgi:hypothetical protein
MLRYLDKARGQSLSPGYLCYLMLQDILQNYLGLIEGNLKHNAEYERRYLKDKGLFSQLIFNYGFRLI